MVEVDEVSAALSWELLIVVVSFVPLPWRMSFLIFGRGK